MQKLFTRLVEERPAKAAILRTFLLNLLPEPQRQLALLEPAPAVLARYFKAVSLFNGPAAEVDSEED